MPNPTVGSREGRSARSGLSEAGHPRGASAQTVDPLELAHWLEEKKGEIADRWIAEVQARGDRERDSDLDAVVASFLHLLTRLLPGLVGPLKDQVEPLWRQAAELYGNAGALRGLASGEAIEEFQLLREVLIRQLFLDPPGGDGRSLGLREILALNRIVDDGVTFAGVGHTDSLFFALFQGTGVSDSVTPAIEERLRGQVGGIQEEFEKLGPVL